MKKMRTIFSFVLAMLFLFSGAVTVAAETGNVTYSGDAGQFIFAPGSANSPTDLFPDFKDVMPGDIIHQRIVIRNDASEEVKIKVYLRALGAHEGSEEFLSQLKLRVETADDTALFQAPADETAQLTDWVCLGLVYSGGEIELDVLLEVPTSLDNNYKNLIGYLDWEFMIEEFPVEDDDPKPPPRGDDFRWQWYAAGLAGSVFMILLLILWEKKRKEDESAE